MAFKEPQDMSREELEREVDELRKELDHRNRQVFERNFKSQQDAGTGSIAIGDGNIKDA